MYLFWEIGIKSGLNHILDHGKCHSLSLTHCSLVSISDHIQNLYEEAARRKHWLVDACCPNISWCCSCRMAVRLAASILNKVVDCLAPSLSHLLVKEKEVLYTVYMYVFDMYMYNVKSLYCFTTALPPSPPPSLPPSLPLSLPPSLPPSLSSSLLFLPLFFQISIGVFGFPEHTITEPLTPKEISQIMYDQCMPYEPIEAVLQQEVESNTHLYTYMYMYWLIVV